MGKGVDCVSALPVDLLAPYEFVARYVCYPSNPKCVQVSEVRAYAGAKKGTVLVYEDGATDALGGAPTGRQKAAIALPTLQGLREVGRPLSAPVYFAVDFGPTTSQLRSALDCAVAFAQSIGAPPAVYGNADMCAYAHARGVRYLWEWGDNLQGVRAPDAFASIYQNYPPISVGAFECDENLSLASDYGQWPRTALEAPVWIDKLQSGETVLMMPEASRAGGQKGGFVPIGPEWVAFLESRGVPSFSGPVPSALVANWQNFGPYAKKSSLVGRLLGRK